MRRPLRGRRAGSPPLASSGPLAGSVVVVAYDGLDLLDLATVTQVFSSANGVGACPPYRVVVAGVDERDVVSQCGVRVTPHLTLDAVEDAGTVFVPGGCGAGAAARDPDLVRRLRRLAGDAQRIAALGAGTTVLERTGLLDGRRTTTHWSQQGTRRAGHRPVGVDAPPLFVRDGKFATCAGATATVDLALTFVEEDHGAETGRLLTQLLVAYMRRHGHQSQASPFTAMPHVEDRMVRSLLALARSRPDSDLRTEALAARVGVSSRHLSRLFREHLGSTPAAAVRRVRLDIAADLIATTEMPLGLVARRCGFGSAESLRQAFTSRFGVSPRAHRQRHRGAAAGGAGRSSA